MTELPEYFFSIEISEDSGILKQPALLKNIKKPGNTKIISKDFITYDSCVASLKKAFVELARIDMGHNGKFLTVFHQMNPVLMNVHDDSWDIHHIARVFLVNFDKFNTSNQLEYDIDATIWTSIPLLSVLGTNEDFKQYSFDF